MVRFLPFDRTDEEGVNIVLQHIDFSIQYGEDLEFKEPKVKKQTKTTKLHIFCCSKSKCSKLIINNYSSHFICRSWMKNLLT